MSSKWFLMPPLLALACFLSGSALAQAPVITYSTPQVYTLGNTVTPLVPQNSGGPVPATLYGDLVTVAGNGHFGDQNGNGTAAEFGNLYGVTVASDGNIYVVEPGNYLVRKVTPNGDVTNLVGGGPGTNTQGGLPRNGQGSAASFAGPFNACSDANDNIYVADPGGNGNIGVDLIRKVTVDGYMTTVAGGSNGFLDGPVAVAQFNGPFGIAIDASVIFTLRTGEISGSGKLITTAM